jgi:hypothetical protein
MLPESLFRYYPASLQTLDSIKKQCFYFGSVEKFNDPFECHVVRPSANDDDQLIQIFRDRYSKLPDIPESVRRQILEMDAKSFSEMIKRSAVDSVALAKKEFIANRGVICFSERNENLLMWSHYSSGGCGVCLEFRTSSEIFGKAFKVRYGERPPQIDALDVMKSTLIDRDPKWIVDMYCTKPDDWDYEQEWRVIHQKLGTFFYPKECLKAVYFGPRCTTSFMEIVCLTLLGQNKGVEFWRGSVSEMKYEVEFEKFTYTPFCDIPQKTP